MSNAIDFRKITPIRHVDEGNQFFHNTSDYSSDEDYKEDDMSDDDNHDYPGKSKFIPRRFNSS